MSSRLQRVAGLSWSAGVLVASDSTSMRSEGGKAPRPTGPRRILKPGEPVREIPGAPQAHSMTITAHLGGHPEIRRMVGCGGPQDEPTPERQGLRGGMRAGKRLQLGPFLVR